MAVTLTQIVSTVAALVAALVASLCVFADWLDEMRQEAKSERSMPIRLKPKGARC